MSERLFLENLLDLWVVLRGPKFFDWSKTMRTNLLIGSLLFFVVSCTSQPKVFFISPKNGDTISSTFNMKFGSENLTVVPAGTDIDDKTKGHFHILVDRGFFPKDQVIPMDETHIHYGKGQKEASLTLPPGKHKLTLQFADGAHRSSGRALSETITVTVK